MSVRLRTKWLWDRIPVQSLELKILIFWTKFAPKGYFRLKTENIEHYYWILHIRISLGTKFHFKQTILNYGTKFARKRKQKNVGITIAFSIFELVSVSNFSLNWHFWLFVPNLPKQVISGVKQKNWTFACVHGWYLLY